jgi:phosphohistidine phosphatase
VPLRLDLVRHGEAMPAGPAGDAARPLSDRGRQAIARLAQEYARRGWRPGGVWSSPLARARETASLLVERAAPGLAAKVLGELAPETEPEALAEALRARAVAGHVVLVGHQPLLGRLAGHLAGAPDHRLSPAGLVALACAEPLRGGCARIELEIRPDQIG